MGTDILKRWCGLIDLITTHCGVCSNGDSKGAFLSLITSDGVQFRIQRLTVRRGFKTSMKVELINPPVGFPLVKGQSSFSAPDLLNVDPLWVTEKISCIISSVRRFRQQRGLT